MLSVKHDRRERYC